MTKVNTFNISMPSNDLKASEQFFTNVLQCSVINKSNEVLQYNFFNHRLFLYFISDKFIPQQHCNNVDKHDVPVPHFGIALTVDQFKTLRDHLFQHQVKFIIQPHIRFQGLVGQQYTMFFKDPSGNNLQFKAMTNPSYLFAK